MDNIPRVNIRALVDPRHQNDADPRRRGNHQGLFEMGRPVYADVEDQNPLNIQHINVLHDRVLGALYDVPDKIEQAMDISQATFEAWTAIERAGGDATVLFHNAVSSNIFGQPRPAIGTDFHDMMDVFSSIWVVYNAFYQLADLIVGCVSCSSSDQMMIFKLRWNMAKRHFVIESLNHVTEGNDEMLPAQVLGVRAPIHRFRLEAHEAEMAARGIQLRQDEGSDYEDDDY